MKEKIKKIIENSDYDIGLYICDTRNNSFGYNENKIFETASCIKLFILLEFYKQIYEGKKKENDLLTYKKEDKVSGADSGIIGKLEPGLKLTAKDLATLMIIYSDNIATNKLIDYLGLDNINQTIIDLGFKNTKILHELNLFKYFEFGITTPYEYAKAYLMILNGEMINKEISKNVLEVLKKQEKSDIMKKSLPQYDFLFRGDSSSQINYVASKSGGIIYTGDEMKNCRNDGGIVSTKYGDYIFTIFISNLDDLQWTYDNKGVELGASIGKIVFNNFIENKGEFK